MELNFPRKGCVNVENKGCCFGENLKAEKPIKINSDKPKESKIFGKMDAYELFVDDAEESVGCCCGGEHPDESTLDNPDEVKVQAEANFINKFENYAHSIGITSVGYTQISSELIIEDKPIIYPNTIVLTIEMSKNILKTPTGPEAQKLNDLAYKKLGNMTYKLSDYLRENGFSTQVAHPYGSWVNFSALSQKAGMGFIGKSGLLITPQLGPRQKISAIFTSITNLPIKEHQDHSWIAEYCEKCGKCIKACPEKALIEKETCCGGKEIEFIQKLCRGCSEGCTDCMEACPFNKKGYEHVKNRFDKMNAKLMEKTNKKR
jgi:ferredoxin